MNNLTSLFIKLVTIPSPSGKEITVTKFINQKLKSNNWQTSIDVSGNLIATKDDNIEFWFVAHIDTVEKGNVAIKPIITNNIITSIGDTILGADNKAGVAVLLDLAINSKYLDRFGIIFTNHEEKGSMSSQFIKFKTKPKLILNIDGSEKLGIINQGGLGQTVFKLIIYGKASHAAKGPEDGVNAIHIASKIISSIKQGKDKNNNTCNIGSMISNGDTNVVSSKVTMIGEIRSFSKLKINKKIKSIHNLSQKICDKYGGKFSLTINESDGVKIWEQKPDKYLKNIKNSVEKTNLTFNLVPMFACSDANYLSQFAPTYSINHGGQYAHSIKESISFGELNLTQKLIINLTKELVL